MSGGIYETAQDKGVQEPAHVINRRKRRRQRILRRSRSILVTALFAVTMIYLRFLLFLI